eukprot:TRINITY_DN100730_c0_g1_i1.p1 TRINITY_DN100730_c0_g1~~TRINITY_DN100730_c0_g1_i1.p1  ORF type:complete len:596 (+),score=191.50 TRINITY_DN100730_c0_g1_i1:159-1946(+)
MSSRPSSREVGQQRITTPGSLGGETVEQSIHPSVIAEEMVGDLTQDAINNLTSSASASPDAEDMKAKIEQLQAELESSRSELEFMNLSQEELENRNENQEEEIQRLREEVNRLEGTAVLGGSSGDASTQELQQLKTTNATLKAELASVRSEMEFMGLKEEELQSSKQDAQRQIEELQASLAQLGAGGAASAKAEAGNSDAAALRELTALRSQHVELREELTRTKQEAAAANESLKLARAEVEMVQKHKQQFGKVAGPHSEDNMMDSTMDFPPEMGSEDTPLLAAAYQQISVLNTQLAHLYTELTLARTEAQNLRTQQQLQAEGLAQTFLGGESTTVDMQKQSQQIADLVGDIRHLQLDLEYHQQKLDQMLEEKQQMMKDLKKCQNDLSTAKLQVEERDQIIKHREVDISSLKQQLAHGGGANAAANGGAGGADGAMLAALRAEASAKDSALIVSHYELHKEKLLRDRLEQKNLKLMERMQKLMMVVETMRKDNVNLERSLAAKERSYEEKELKLRQVAQKAKSLQKQVKARSIGIVSGKQTIKTSLEFEAAPSQTLPPVSGRTGSARGGRTSGMSTPRGNQTPRRDAPPSPYGTR